MHRPTRPRNVLGPVGFLSATSLLLFGRYRSWQSVHSRWRISLLCVALLLTHLSFAQQTRGPQNITGQVVDQTGGVLQDVQVILLDGSASIRLKETRTGQNGTFAFEGVHSQNSIASASKLLISLIATFLMSHSHHAQPQPHLVGAEPATHQAGQTCAVLLAATGREPTDAAAVRGDGAQDRRLTGGDGVEGGWVYTQPRWGIHD